MDAMLRVRVTPRAGRDAIEGWREGVLRVRLAAAPVEGKANESLVRFLAASLGVPRRDVELVAGDAWALRAGGARARPGAPPQHRPDLRRRRGGWGRLPGDGDRRGPLARRDARRRWAAAAA